jgi:hypothetical protein
MAGFKVTATITRSGQLVAGATVTLGHLGVFTGDQDGEVEMEIDDWGEGLTIVLPMIITDPSDGLRCTSLMLLTDGDTPTIEMSSNARYSPSSGYSPPSP